MPSNTEFLFKVAIGYETTEPERAAELYRQLLQDDPEHTASRINLGTIFYNQHNLKEAGTQYRLAIAADPKYALAYFNLGNVEDELGNGEEAIKCYKKALAVAPTYDDAHYNLALAYEKKREPMKALPHWQKYVKLDITGPWRNHAHAQVTRILAGVGLKVVRSNLAPVRVPGRAPLEVMQPAPQQQQAVFMDQLTKRRAARKATQDWVQRPLFDLSERACSEGAARVQAALAESKRRGYAAKPRRAYHRKTTNDDGPGAA